MPPASVYLMGCQRGPHQPKSFLIEKPQTTFCGLMSHHDIYKSPQQPGIDRSPPEDCPHVSASGQARGVLVREEVSLVHGHPDTLPSPVLLWAL